MRLYFRAVYGLQYRVWCVSATVIVGVTDTYKRANIGRHIFTSQFEIIWQNRWFLHPSHRFARVIHEKRRDGLKEVFYVQNVQSIRNTVQ